MALENGALKSKENLPGIGVIPGTREFTLNP